MRPRRRPDATVVLLRNGAELARFTLARHGGPDLSVVDELARLQLAARRVGCSIAVRRASDALARLVDLVGLADVLAVEVGGQAEGGEESGVEEIVVADDPVA